MQQEEHTDEISLKELILKIKDWFSYLWSKWLLILCFGIIGGVLGLVYALKQKPVYTGSLIFILSSESKAGGLAGLAGQLGVDFGGGGSNGAFEGENIIELLKSRKIVKGALFKKLPDENVILINLVGEEIGFFKGWKKDKRLAALLPFPENIEKLTPVQDSLIGTIHNFLVKNHVTIAKPDKKLSFYAVKTTSTNEKIAVHLTKHLVDEAANMYIDTKTKTAKQTVDMLQKEANELRGKLSGTIYSSATTVDQTFNLNPAFQTQRSPIQQNQVQMQALGAAYTEVFKNLEISKMNLQKETPLYQIIDEPKMPLVQQCFGKLKGIVLGGIIAGFLCVFFLLGRKIFRGIME